MENAQDLTKPLGKIHRVNDDGTAPKDNPFVATAGAVPTIWSYGHRNPEGLAWDPVTGLLWESEHGPTAGDEINIIEPRSQLRVERCDEGHAGWREQDLRARHGRSGRLLHADARAGRHHVRTRAIDIPAGRTRASSSAGLPASNCAGSRSRVDRSSVRRSCSPIRPRARLVQGPDGYFYVALQNPTGAGTGVGLAASTPGVVIRSRAGPVTT